MLKKCPHCGAHHDESNLVPYDLDIGPRKSIYLPKLTATWAGTITSYQRRRRYAHLALGIGEVYIPPASAGGQLRKFEADATLKQTTLALRLGMRICGIYGLRGYTRRQKATRYRRHPEAPLGESLSYWSSAWDRRPQRRKTSHVGCSSRVVLTALYGSRGLAIGTL